MQSFLNYFKNRQQEVLMERQKAFDHLYSKLEKSKKNGQGACIQDAYARFELLNNESVMLDYFIDEVEKRMHSTSTLQHGQLQIHGNLIDDINNYLVARQVALNRKCDDIMNSLDRWRQERKKISRDVKPVYDSCYHNYSMAIISAEFRLQSIDWERGTVRQCIIRILELMTKRIENNKHKSGRR